MIALVTPRLVLRPWTPADLDPFAELCADEEVMRFIGDGSTRTTVEARALIEREKAAWRQHGRGLFAVERQDTGQFIGFCGLTKAPNLLPPLQSSIEIGWRLARSQWGQGFATEAAVATVDWAFSAAGLSQLVAVVQLDNAASHRVAVKTGMERVQRAIVRGQGIAVDVYALSRDLWLTTR